LPSDQKQQEKDNHQQFHPKVHVLSSIQFTENETQLLNKELKYNLHFKPKNLLKTLSLKAEPVISYADE
jgi:hypothetical protein